MLHPLFRPRRLLILAGLLAVFCSCSGLPASAATSAAPASGAVYKVTPTPAGSGTQYNVSCWSASGCISLGDDEPPLEWNGSSWSKIATFPGEELSNGDIAFGLSCVSADFCLAVGDLGIPGQPSHFKPGAWRWNGTSWAQVTAYAPGAERSALYDVDCLTTSYCEAVGNYANPHHGLGYPLAETWNGSALASQSTYGAPPAALQDVSCAAAGKCEAVGYGDDGTFATGLAGSTWTTQPSGAGLGGSTSALLQSVSCWSSGCTAVGYAAVGAQDISQDLAARWNGSSWSLQGALGSADPPGDSQYGNYMTGVSCQSASQCTADSYYFEHTPTDGYVETWNGSSWQVVAYAPSDSDLYGLSCVDNGSVCTTVGDQGKTGAALIERN